MLIFLNLKSFLLYLFFVVASSLSILWSPIFKDQLSSACVNPCPSSCINTNPSSRLSSKGINECSMNFVIERFGLGFKKTSCFESILFCSFTEFLCISIIYSVRFLLSIETVGNIYYLKGIQDKSNVPYF